MKEYTTAIFGLLILTLVLATGTSHGYTYTVDGQLDDWGVDLKSSNPDAARKGYLDSHLPSGSSVQVVHEDNADKYAEWTEVVPLWSYHNYFDAEAMYFDNDSKYAYIAVVTGLPKAGNDPPGNPIGGDMDYAFKPGDIAIKTKNDAAFSYGIDIDEGSDPTTRKLKSVTDWASVCYPEGYSANPYMIVAGTAIGDVAFVYGDEQNSHYVLEAAIPLSALGLAFGDSVTVHWTMECGNDFLDLNATVKPVSQSGPLPVPEPGPFFLAGMGMLVGVVARCRSLSGQAGIRRQRPSI